MELVYIILPLALAIATFALVAFIWAARSGQFDDLETPSRRVLFDDVPLRDEELGPSAEAAPDSAKDEPGQA